MIKPQALTAIPLCQPHQELWNAENTGLKLTSCIEPANRSQKSKKVVHPFEVTTELNCILLTTLEL